MPDINMPLEATNPADGYQTRTAGDKVYVVAPSAYAALTKIVTNLAAEFLQQRKYTVGAANGYIIVSDADGNEVWTAPGSVVPPALVGDPITLNIFGGTEVVTPQIQARLTGANQIPFYSVHEATDAFGGFDAMGAYRGTLPSSLSLLQAGDGIRGIGCFVPFDSSSWVGSGSISFSVPTSHSAGNYPVQIQIVSNSGVSINAPATDVSGLLTGSGRAVITADAADTDPTLTINENASGQAAGTRAIQVNDAAAVEKFYVDLDGNTSVGGGLGVNGTAQFFSGVVFQGSATFVAGITIDTGQGISISEAGAAARAGVATLVAGTVTVSTTAVTANSRFLYSVQTAGGVQGFLSVSATVVGTSFTLLSTNVLDTSTVYWTIIEP